MNVEEQYGEKGRLQRSYLGYELQPRLLRVRKKCIYIFQTTCKCDYCQFIPILFQNKPHYSFKTRECLQNEQLLHVFAACQFKTTGHDQLKKLSLDKTLSIFSS